MNHPAPDARQAATVVLFRDRPDGPPDLLMMQRAKSMAFAAGALVFPGGAVDADDIALAQAMGRPWAPDEAAARIAAIRETLEESGMGLGFPDGFAAAALEAMRIRMDGGAAFSALLAEQAIVLDLNCLTPFARWHPAALERAHRIYDTRFYLARAPEGQEASADETENVHLFWRSAAETIAQCDAGDGRIIFPTRRNLERLALCDSFDAAVDHARSIPVEKVTPWIDVRDGQRHLCIADHLGYPVTSELMASADRH